METSASFEARSPPSPYPAAIVKQAYKNADRASTKDMRASLTLKSDSARNILAEIVAGGSGVVAKPSKQLGRPSLGNSGGGGR
jgi:hypothetical protein